MTALDRDRAAGAATQLAAEVSMNFGSSIAGLLIPIVGAVVVVTARQLIIAAVLVPFSRRRFRGEPARSLRAYWPAVALGIALAMMNLGFYEGIGRLGLGITATVEFLGPLSLALVASRRMLDVGCALGAAFGVVLLTSGEGTIDPLGIAFALGAGASWAGYILLTRRVAVQFTGLQGLTIASVVALALLAPAALLVIDYRTLTWPVVGLLGATGLLCSVIPYSLDTFILRRITPRLYAIITSCSPAIAAGFGAIVLAESFSAQQLLAILIVCLSAGTAIATQQPAHAELPASAVKPEEIGAEAGNSSS